MIVLTTKYPSQAAVDGVNYPLAGKARNVTASGDGTGTPLEKDWMNDLFGWQQALMAQAGLTPSGTVETQLASQLLQAIQLIVVQRPVALYRISGTRASGAIFALAAGTSVGAGWALAADTITVPAAGKYRVSFNGLIKCTDATNPLPIGSFIAVGGSSTGVNCSSQPIRYSATATDLLPTAAESIVTITTPGSQGITIVSSQNNTQFQGGNLIVEQVG